MNDTQNFTSNGIPGPKVLLMGETGTGKTYSIRTLVDAGITPFVLFTEPGMETLGDLPDGKWHYKYVKPFTQSWGALEKMVRDINKLDYEMLTKVKDSSRSQYTGMIDFIVACNAFTCDCHGTKFGDVSTWGTERALVVDSLTGLGDMAMGNVVGGRPTRSQPDWGVAMNTIKMVLGPLTTATKCTFVLLSHLAREKDEITGGTQVTVNTLGQRLAPDIPRMFSDVINTVRVGSEWTWDTASANMAVKARNLPIASKQPPSFVPLINTWKSRGGVTSPIQVPTT
jgi:AAA domain